jgi:hypothetical protein
VVGHADWESQNIRWRGDRPLAVHDWDSAVAQPEPVVAGLAAAVWPADGTPDRAATLQQTEQFVAAHEQARGRPWTPAERQACWAAGLWVRAFSAKKERLSGGGPQLGPSRRRGGRTRRQGRPGGGGRRVAWGQGRVAGEVGVAWV